MRSATELLDELNAVDESARIEAKRASDLGKSTKKGASEAEKAIRLLEREFKDELPKAMDSGVKAATESDFNDGDVDILVNNLDAAPSLLRSLTGWPTITPSTTSAISSTTIG